MKVKVYVATHCHPCQTVKELLGSGHFSVNCTEGVAEVIDIETEEGFRQLNDLVDGVPSAVSADGKQCKIQIDEENDILILECPDGTTNTGKETIHSPENAVQLPADQAPA